MRITVRRFPVLFGLAALAVLLCLSLAEAARLGGSRSFGSRSTYSRSYSKPVAPTYAPTQTPSAAPTQAKHPAPAAPGPLGAPQPSMFSRMGWGLGGLMAGGLIGSMLFGRGMGGFGGGMGFLDILLIGVIIYFAVKLLRRRGQTSGDAPAQGGWQAPPSSSPDTSEDARARAAQNWDALRSKPEAGGTGGFGAATATPEPAAETVAGPTVPDGFIVPEFLEGAKTVYARLQHSWDRRDLDDIALFTTQEVLEEIKRQAALDPKPSKTELLLINARLLEFKEEATDTVVSVYFDVLLREDASEDKPRQIREVWHFSRPTGDLNANWRLEGIQQLEA